MSIYHEHLASLIVKTLSCEFLNFHLTVSRNPCTYFVTHEDVILIFLRDLKTNLYKHNHKEVESVHYIKVYANMVLKNDFICVETSHMNLLYQLRSRPLTHQRAFDLKYTQDILQLHIA